MLERRLKSMLTDTRNSIANEEWEFAKVSDFSAFGEFDYGNDDLNDFIANEAIIHKKELIAETYFFRFRDIDTPPLAFVSLLNDSIKLSTNRERRLVPNKIRLYPEFPAVKIGRLGVKKEFQMTGIGTIILDIIKSLFTTNNRTGCRFLTVEAYAEKKALNFYQKNDFRFFPGQEANIEEETRLMFFDLKNYVDNMFLG